MAECHTPPIINRSTSRGTRSGNVGNPQRFTKPASVATSGSKYFLPEETELSIEKRGNKTTDKDHGR